MAGHLRRVYDNTEAHRGNHDNVGIYQRVHGDHTARPKRLGLTLDELTDVRGFHYGAAFAAVPEGEGRWVSHWFINATTGQHAQKHSWVVRFSGILFGSDWYESGPT